MATLTKIKDLCKEDLFRSEYKTGFKNIDDIIEGIDKGMIITIGARPGMGKTTFGQSIMLNMLNQYKLPTLYVSLEMGKALVLESLCALISKNSPSKIKFDKKMYQNAKDTLAKNDSNLYITDDCFTVFDLEKLLIENNNIECLFIDYIQLMKIDLDAGTRFNTNEVVNQIKKIARKYNVIIFLISQLSRRVEHREQSRPVLPDLSESGNLESNSDVVLFLYRDDYYDIEKDVDITPIEIIISKNRNGSCGLAVLEFDRAKRIFNDFKYTPKP